MKIRQLAKELNYPEGDLRALIRNHLDNGAHKYKNCGTWHISDLGIVLLKSLIDSQTPDVLPSDLPELPTPTLEPFDKVPDHHKVDYFEVKVLKLPINQRLVIVDINGNPCRATIRPAMRKMVQPGNMLFVEHMEADIYNVVRRAV